MPTVQSTGTLTTMVLDYYKRTFLENQLPQLFFHQFGEKASLPKGEGDTIVWHRWNLFTKGRYITESGAGASRYISATKVSCNLWTIGDHAVVTTYIDMVAINSVVEGAVKLFGYSSADTIDFCVGRLLLWRRTALSATLEVSSANGYVGSCNILSSIGTLSAAQFQAPLWAVQFPSSRSHAASALDGGNSAVDADALLTPGKLRQFVLKLRVKNALPFPNGHYKCITHPDLINQLRGSSAFIDMYKYTDNSIVSDGKLKGGDTNGRGYRGYMEGVDFYESTNAPWCSVTNGATGASANGNGRFYFSFLFGPGAYGITDFDSMKGEGAQIIVKTPGPQSTNDPLNQWSTIGYKAIFAAKILNPSCCMWLISGKPKVTG